VFVKCRDLYIADDGDGNLQLGIKVQNTIGRIPGGSVSKYLIGGKWGLSIEPVVVTISDLNTVPTQMLVRINDVQFDASDTGITYANASTQQSAILEIEDCSNNFVDLYTSGYASFAGELTPPGKGSVTAIYKLYSGDPELLIRNSSDVNMTGSRCGAGGTTTILKTIQQIKDTADTSGTIIIPDGWTIRGTVISDISQGNITAKNIAVQDGAHGIIIRFTSNNSAIQLNDSVQIDLTGGELYYYFGLLEVDQVPNARATVLGTGTIAPAPVTISQIESDVNAYQSTLVVLNGVTLSGNTSFAGSVTVTQGVETINMFTSASALFAGNPLPAGTVNLVGLVNVQNGSAEIKMRSASDVQ
jgi:hypothetical protein